MRHLPTVDTLEVVLVLVVLVLVALTEAVLTEVTGATSEEEG